MTDIHSVNHHADEGDRDPGLTARQSRFVEEYLIDLNATQAALRAGYSPKTAYAQGARLLKHPEVAEAIDAAIQERSERLGLQADDVVLELTRIAFSDIIDYAEWDSGNVRVRESCDIPAEARRAIAAVTRTANGSVGVRLHGKVRALDMLAKHLGMYDIRREPTRRADDARLLTDEELIEIIQEGRDAEAGAGIEDGESSTPGR